ADDLAIHGLRVLELLALLVDPGEQALLRRGDFARARGVERQAAWDLHGQELLVLGVALGHERHGRVIGHDADARLVIRALGERDVLFGLSFLEQGDGAIEVGHGLLGQRGAAREHDDLGLGLRTALLGLTLTAVALRLGLDRARRASVLPRYL